MSKIFINQLGYRNGDQKIFVTTIQSKTFHVINEENNQIVYSGNLMGGQLDEATLDVVYYGDFTSLSLEGKYIIEIEQTRSYPFEISDTVYVNAQNGLLKALYFQRCGCVLLDEHAGVWKHDVCHTSMASLYEDPSRKLDVSGGWHDAGDYGRYVVPAAKAVADLLYAFDLFPNAFKEPIFIPESGNGLPDVLNEAKYEIDWLFKMQDEHTGGVYNKVATQWFPGMIMPEKDLNPLIIYPISSPATADFAATMALAARIYKPFFENYSIKCLAAAEKAWDWLMNNPMTLFKNKPDIGSGEYGDRTDLDEKFWAAAELYRVTGNDKYHQFFKQTLPNLNNILRFGWGDMSGYGSLAYLLTENKDQTIYEDIKNKLIEHAYELVEISQNDGYKVTLKPKGYNWGSNMGVLNHAMHLIIANHLQPDAQFIKTAIDQWNYIFGLNSLNISYVSGFGSNPIMNPHHRPSEDDGIKDPVPGLVSGGPCAGLHDKTAKDHCEGLPPAKCFIDHMGSYSTNEITIYWNSPAVFVAAYLNNRS